MATPAGLLITDILQHVRDPQGSAHSRSLVLTLLSHVQRLVNGMFSSVIVEESLSVEQRKLLYSIEAELPNSLKIKSVRHRSLELFESSLNEVGGFDSVWPRTMSAQFSAYATIGRDLLLLYPMLPFDSTVTVVSAKDTGTIPQESTNMEVPDHSLNIIRTMTELILLLRLRELPRAQEKLAALQKQMQDFVDV